jgi:hypothetical protein
LEEEEEEEEEFGAKRHDRDAQQTGTAGMLAQGWVETNVAQVGIHN